MGTATGQAPFTPRIEQLVVAVATGVTAEVPVLRMPFAGTVWAVTYVPAATITGANTNTRRVSIVNHGLNGAGTTEVAALQFDSGVNATAFDEKTLTLSSTAADRDVAEGAVLSFKSTHVGTGLADPGGLVIISLARD